MNKTNARKTRLAAAMAVLMTPAFAMAQSTQNQDPQNQVPQNQQQNQQQNQNQARTGAMTGNPYDAQTSREGRDAYREGLIWGTYAANPALNAYRLGVDVQGDRAVLTGRVESAVDKLLAERIAKRAQGVTQVDNRIEVDPMLIVAVFEPMRTDMQSDTSRTDGTASTTDDTSSYANSGSSTVSSEITTRNSTGTDTDANRRMDGTAQSRIDDRPGSGFTRGVADDTLAARVTSRLLWNAQTDGTDIQVSARNGVVTLTGRADTEASKNTATRLARTTRGVVRVDNRLSVDPNGQVAQAEAGEGDRAMSDTWVAAKVNSSLMWSAGVDADDIDVEARDGVVSLTGTADSAASKRQAIELAQGVRGVKRVDASGLRIDTAGSVSQR